MNKEPGVNGEMYRYTDFIYFLYEFIVCTYLHLLL